MQKAVIRLQVVGLLGRKPLLVALRQVECERVDNLLCDVVLHGKDVGQVAIEPLRPPVHNFDGDWDAADAHVWAMTALPHPRVRDRHAEFRCWSDPAYFGAAAAVSPGGMIRNMKLDTFSPGLNGPGTWLPTGFTL
jgi:hypothetical protein